MPVSGCGQTPVIFLKTESEGNTISAVHCNCAMSEESTSTITAYLGHCFTSQVDKERVVTQT